MSEGSDLVRRLTESETGRGKEREKEIAIGTGREKGTEKGNERMGETETVTDECRGEKMLAHTINQKEVTFTHTSR